MTVKTAGEASLAEALAGVTTPVSQVRETVTEAALSGTKFLSTEKVSTLTGVGEGEGVGVGVGVGESVGVGEGEVGFGAAVVTEVGAGGGARVKAEPRMGSEVGPAMVGSAVCDGSANVSAVAVGVASFWSEPGEPLLAISNTSALSVMSIASSANANVRTL